MYVGETNHVFGHADTDTMFSVEGTPPPRRTPQTPWQWRDRMGPGSQQPPASRPVINYLPGDHAQNRPLQVTTPDHPTAPQPPMAPFPLEREFHISRYQLESIAHDIRIIRNIWIAVFFLGLLFVIAVIAIGTDIANDMTSFTSITHSIQ